MTTRTSTFAVAHAIHRGLITEEEAGADAIEMLRVQLAFLRDQEDDDSAQLPNTRLQRSLARRVNPSVRYRSRSLLRKVLLKNPPFILREHQSP